MEEHASGALDRELRRRLERSVRAARRIAEEGARAALDALSVAATEAGPGLSDDQRALRRRLRAHARQLGDQPQEITRLAHEVAFEHWHRMLFSRFLAENGLLIEPESAVAVSLEECRDLARERGDDPWALAGRFAEAMLPRIFRPDDPSLALQLPPEALQALEKKLADLPPAVFRADDSLGWTYQFWQTDRKDEVNQSGAKIGADELPAVTQLFTEPYMVRFLFHNTVGAWRAGRILEARPELARGAANEADLRETIRLDGAGGYDFDYLRFVREPPTDEGAEPGDWRPASGSFPKWPRRAAELRFLDPCCGSGHFLVEGLHLFVRLRMEEDGLAVEEAVRAVLEDNLHGLEIDPRCAQIAAFAVAFAAWNLAGRVIELPPLRIACSGLAPNATKDEWLSLAERTAGAAGSPPDKRLFGTQETLTSGALRHTFGRLHDLFAEAPSLGSLIEPRAAGEDLLGAGFDAIRPLLDAVLAEKEGDPEGRERAVTAAGMAEAAQVLADGYSLVITNVPYLARGKQSGPLRTLGDTRLRAGKGDLATMFVERSLGWLGGSGAIAVVVPQNWLFLTSYRKLRENLLRERRWRLVARLGTKAFETPMWDFNIVLAVLSVETPETDWRMAGLDVSSQPGEPPIRASEKATLLTTKPPVPALQSLQLQNPDAAVTQRPIADSILLNAEASAMAGMLTGDVRRFCVSFWELPGLRGYWALQQTTVRATVPFGGRSVAVQFSGDSSETVSPFETLHDCVERGKIAWTKRGVGVSSMGPLPVTLYTGGRFDPNISVVVPRRPNALSALWCFCSSPEYAKAVREIDQKLNVTNATLAKVPFDLTRWKKAAAERYPNGLPEPYSDDPTQWLFHGHPCGSVVWDEEAKRTAYGPTRFDASVLQVAVARLAGYRWPAESDPEMRLAAEQRALVGRCRELDGLADEDGIVCLPAARGEAPATARLRSLLAAAYGDAWEAGTERRLLGASANGKPAPDLESWLRRDFFAEHCRLFHQRPFIWQIWDGLPNGFSALVNYHRLAGPGGEGRRTLESLTFSYLGDWKERAKGAVRDGETGAEGRLAAAVALQARLEAILDGKPPLDLFVRWKPLHRQAIGWEPDLDDGVRLNIRPFLRAELPKGGRTGAGVLREKPNIKWKKDRGKEPQRLRARRKGEATPDIRPRADFPWFWSAPGEGSESERTDFQGGPAFDGARWNDFHYSNTVKRTARAAKDGVGEP